VELYARVRRAVQIDQMSEREAARTFGLSRETVRKMLKFSLPPGYRRQAPIRRPKLEAYIAVIDQILESDKSVHRKQRHSVKRIFERLRDEHRYRGGYTVVKDYVREQKQRSKEMFVPLKHAPGHAQVDFGEAALPPNSCLRSSVSVTSAAPRWSPAISPSMNGPRSSAPNA
jgi:transposase